MCGDLHELASYVNALVAPKKKNSWRNCIVGKKYISWTLRSFFVIDASNEKKNKSWQANNNHWDDPRPGTMVFLRIYLSKIYPLVCFFRARGEICVVSSLVEFELQTKKKERNLNVFLRPRIAHQYWPVILFTSGSVYVKKDMKESYATRQPHKKKFLSLFACFLFVCHDHLFIAFIP